ncbi:MULTISPECIES: ABC transporter permease [unclassified Clostridium]|uniref:ABC transporter permease n=1 Tax=unclassified Clostridium TaxID=2614128 RepID=UPI0002985D14|nr:MULTISPECIES: ABC transporter permease [unclassified Clostridium]EKQ53434.1 MAG: ABC-type nitrate/sulfonate/bicarbonate transport system, permease component [Clostridium sp. Maddingley MBC34-26]
MKKLLLIRKNLDKRTYLLIAAISFVILFGGWTILSVLGLVNKSFLPTPMAVIQAFINTMKDGTLFGDMYISVFRIFMGFIIAVIIGVPLGILTGTFKSCEAFIQPVTEFIRYMPVPAFIPLIMVWTGIGETAKITVIFIGTLFQLIPMVADNIRSVQDDLVNAGYTLGANKKQVIFKILIPGMMPKLMDTLRMMMGWAWTYLVVAEIVAANSGLGYSILKAQRFLKTDVIFMGILVIGILGLITDRTFAWINKKLFKWAEGGI